MNEQTRLIWVDDIGHKRTYRNRTELWESMAIGECIYLHVPEGPVRIPHIDVASGLIYHRTNHRYYESLRGSAYNGPLGGLIAFQRVGTGSRWVRVLRRAERAVRLTA